MPRTVSSAALLTAALRTRVLATLVASSDVRDRLEAYAKGGHVHVKGRVDEGMKYAVVNTVENAPGDVNVTTDLYPAPAEGILRI
jgi:hypothetical protein